MGANSGFDGTADLHCGGWFHWHPVGRDTFVGWFNDLQELIGRCVPVEGGYSTGVFERKFAVLVTVLVDGDDCFG